jgi:hypothetical protein
MIEAVDIEGVEGPMERGIGPACCKALFLKTARPSALLERRD